MTFAPDDDRERSAEVRLPRRQRGVRLRAHDPDPANVEIRQRTRKVAHRAEQQVLSRAGRGLHRGRAEGGLPLRWEKDAMGAGCLGAPEDRPQVLRVLKRIEDEHEGWLSTFNRSGEDFLEGCETTRLHHEGDALVSVEAGERCQGPALDLDDRDPERGGMENDPFKRLPPARSHQQADRGPPSRERLLDRTATGDQLFSWGELLRIRNSGTQERAAVAAERRQPVGPVGRSPIRAGTVRRVVPYREVAGGRSTERSSRGSRAPCLVRPWFARKRGPCAISVARERGPRPIFPTGCPAAAFRARDPRRTLAPRGRPALAARPFRTSLATSPRVRTSLEPEIATRVTRRACFGSASLTGVGPPS